MSIVFPKAITSIRRSEVQKTPLWHRQQPQSVPEESEVERLTRFSSPDGPQPDTNDDRAGSFL